MITDDNLQYIERLAVHPTDQGRSTAREILNLAEKLGYERKPAQPPTPQQLAADRAEEFEHFLMRAKPYKDRDGVYRGRGMRGESNPRYFIDDLDRQLESLIGHRGRYGEPTAAIDPQLVANLNRVGLLKSHRSNIRTGDSFDLEQSLDIISTALGNRSRSPRFGREASVATEANIDPFALSIIQAISSEVGKADAAQARREAEWRASLRGRAYTAIFGEPKKPN